MSSPKCHCRRLPCFELFPLCSREWCLWSLLPPFKRPFRRCFGIILNIVFAILAVLVFSYLHFSLIGGLWLGQICWMSYRSMWSPLTWPMVMFILFPICACACMTACACLFPIYISGCSWTLSIILFDLSMDWFVLHQQYDSYFYMFHEYLCKYNGGGRS